MRVSQSSDVLCRFAAGDDQVLAIQREGKVVGSFAGKFQELSELALNRLFPHAK